MKKGWEIKKLGEVCDIIAGQSPESKFYNSNKIGLPFYQGKKDFGEKYIESPTTWTTYTTKIAEKDDILMSVRAPVGDINFATQQICIGRGLAAIKASQKLNRNFLFYILLSMKNSIKGKEGAVFPSINKNEIESLLIPLPPLSEQQRIVSVLDAAFTKIEAVKEKTARNLQNAKKLFQSELQKCMSPQSSTNKKGWEIKKLGEVCEKKQNIRWKDISDKNTFKYIDLTSVSRISNSISETQNINKNNAPSRAQQIVQKNDILFGTTRPTLKRFCVISKEYDGQICSTGFCVIRPNEKLVIPKWIYYQFSLDDFYNYIEPLQRGANYPAVTDSEVFNFSFPLPPLSEQQQIVSRLDVLSEQVKQLEANYKVVLANCEELKQSVLAKTFNGEI